MLKRIILLLLCASLAFVLCSCSPDSPDEVDTYSIFGDNIFARYAIVYFPDGTTVSGELDYWSMASHNSITYVTIDGVKYITDSENVYLSSEDFE